MRPTSELSDEEIAKRTSTERFLFAVLVDRYSERLSRYIRRLGVSQKEEAEDILQEVFMKVYKNLQEFDDSFPFSSWMYRIAHNETVSHFRKKHARPQGHYVSDSEKAFETIGSDLDIERELDVKISGEQLSKAIGALPEKYRGVIVLRYFEEKSYEEISDILRLPSGSVATLLHRSKKALLKELKYLSP